MRNNGPVTNEEYLVPEGEVIITHTDPSSRITYANPAFLSSSQFSLEECLGQPQNLVRHPDMPKEAFADLWATVKAGRGWTGIVKNRRKNGGYYWVRANVTPMMDGAGRIVGYMSVRVRPRRDEIEHAQRLYDAIRGNRDGHLRIEQGKVVDLSLLGRLRAMANMPLSSGTWVIVGAVVALLVMIGAMNAVWGGSNLITGMAAVAALISFANILYIQSL